MRKKFVCWCLAAVIGCGVFAGLIPAAAAGVIPTYCMDGLVDKAFRGGNHAAYFDSTYELDAPGAPGGDLLTLTRKEGAYIHAGTGAPYLVSVRVPLHVTRSSARLNNVPFDLSDVNLYVEFYMRGVKTEENQSSQPNFDVFIHVRDTATRTQTIQNDVQTAAIDASAQYGAWTKYTKLVTPNATVRATSFRDDIVASVVQTPCLGFQIKADDTGARCFQISGIKVIAYPRTASAEVIQPQLEDGRLNSVTLGNTSVGFDPDTYSYTVNTGKYNTVELVKNALRVTPVTNGGKLIYDWPETLPGTLTVTSYPVTADLTDSAAAASVYRFSLSSDVTAITPAFEVVDAYCAGGKMQRVKVQNNCAVTEPVNGFLCSYTSAGILADVKSIGILSDAAANYTVDNLAIAAGGSVKLMGLSSLQTLRPVRGVQTLEEYLLYNDDENPENILTNAGFEDGTAGWLRTGNSTVLMESYTEDAAEGEKSVHVMETAEKQGAGIRQVITDQIMRYGKGNYLVSFKAKALPGCNELGGEITQGNRVYLYITDESGVQAHRATTFAVGKDWQAFYMIFPIDCAGIPQAVDLRIVGSSSSLGTTNMLYDDVRMCKISETDGSVVRQVNNKPSLFLVGDSIATGYINTASTPIQKGWGEYLGSMFNTDEINYFNFAVGGWSTKTFLQGHLNKADHGATTAGPTWQYQKTLLKPGDMVIVSLGHNDEAITLADTTEEEFKANLATFVNDIRAAGAEVVFVTSSPSRARNVDKTVETWENCLAEYAGYMKEAAAENGVHVIDLNQIIYALECELAKADMLHLKTPVSSGPVRRGHQYLQR